ncbi:MAG TPA: hypothetical protein VMV21_13185, partial [Vicinamibacteria bacterium]|nr:hypothetical protein [Vicinamibacteria bacterium]
GPRELGHSLLTGLNEGARRRNVPLAHVKVLVATAQGSVQIAVTSTGAQPRWSSEVSLGPAAHLSAIVNARAGTDPDTLAAILREAVAGTREHLAARIDERHFECFRPAPPVPRHRLPPPTLPS